MEHDPIARFAEMMGGPRPKAHEGGFVSRQLPGGALVMEYRTGSYLPKDAAERMRLDFEAFARNIELRRAWGPCGEGMP